MLLVFLSLNESILSEEVNLPKILVLIIASDDRPCYIKEQEVWRTHMHYNTRNVEAYFIKEDLYRAKDFRILSSQKKVNFLNHKSALCEDIIWFDTPSYTSSSIINKTILAFEAFLPRIDEFDFVIRTNLSTFYSFPRLLDFLKTAPKSNFYAGTIYKYELDDPFISGDGIILSTDLIELMVEEKELFLDNKVADDLFIGRFLASKGITAVEPVKRLDLVNLSLWDQNKNIIPKSTFQFRVKHEDESLRLKDEIRIKEELIKMFY